jgi:hypothetical protein
MADVPAGIAAALRTAALQPRPALSAARLAGITALPTVFPRPVPTAPPPPRAAPLPTPPAAPASGTPSPFDELPYPAPGDRIRADDFRRLSQCLEIVRDAFLLSGSIVGRTLGESRAALAAQGYAIDRVLSVFGSVLADPADASAEGRIVVHASLAALGERRIFVVISEPVETRRLTPNLMNRTYGDAVNILRAAIGDAALPGGPMGAPQLVGRTLDEVAATFSS